MKDFQLRFHLTPDLEKALTDVVKDCQENLQKEIKVAREAKLVSYRLLKCIYNDNNEKLFMAIKGAPMTGLPLPPQEPEIVKQARLQADEIRYLQMVGKSNQNVVIEDRMAWRQVKLLLRTVFNSLFSIIGAGVAIALLARWSAKMTMEACTMFGITAGLIVLGAEIFMVARRHPL